jgi:uncharacterized protein YjiS (DUF1127 family)
MKHTLAIPLPAVENFSGFLGTILRQLSSYSTETKRKWMQENTIRREIEQLGSLTDGQLSDLGITRMDIPRAVRYGRDNL